MGTGSSNTSSKPQTAELIVCGFVRMIGISLPQTAVIPTELIMLVFEYYNVGNRCILLWSGGSKQTIHNRVKFAMLDSDNNEMQSVPYTLNISDSSGNLSKSETFDCAQCGHSITDSVNIPDWFRKKHPSIAARTDYRMLIRIGGETQGGNRCDITLFDASQIRPLHRYKSELDKQSNEEISIDAFQTRLPDLPVSASSTCSLYHNDFILTVGGMGTAAQHKAYELDFSAETHEWKQCDTSKWKTQYSNTYGVKLCGIHANNVLIIGGYSPPSSTNVVNLYQVGQRQDDAEQSGNAMETVPNMCVARYKPGCCYDAVRHRAFVGGGYGSASEAKKTVEFLDLNKCEKWTQIVQETNDAHMFAPVMWVDDANPDIVYIAGAEVGDHSFSYLQSIEQYDMRDNAPWRIWKSLSALFKDPQSAAWRSRALLTFTA